MTAFEQLPKDPGVYKVETVSGTVHIIDRNGRTMWEPRLGSGRPGVLRGVRRGVPDGQDLAPDIHDHLHHGRAAAVTGDLDRARVDLLRALRSLPDGGLESCVPL